MQGIFECLSAFLACFGFALIFRVHHNPRFAIVGSIGGSLGWVVYLATKPLNNEIISYFWAMMIIAFFSEIAARVYKAPATIFLIIGCFPLVPGRGIYQTMLYCIQGENKLFLNSFIDTLAISASLATAILIVSTTFKVIKKLSILKNKS